MSFVCRYGVSTSEARGLKEDFYCRGRDTETIDKQSIMLTQPFEYTF